MRTARLLLFFLLSYSYSFAQDDKQFTWYQYDDSLHDGSTKDPNGRFYKAGELEMNKEGRLYVYQVSDQFTVYLLIKTPSGQWISKESKIGDNAFYKNSKYSYAELDTFLTESGKYTFYFSSMTTGIKGKFIVQLVYAPKESLYADPKEKDFCKQISFLFKHAEIGFRFLKNGDRYKDTTGLRKYFYYTRVPVDWFDDYNQRIERFPSLDYYSYTAKLFFGSYTDCKSKYDQLKEELKKCLGNYTYEENVAETSSIFKATIKDPDRFIIKTWAAWRKDTKFRFQLSIYRYSDAPNVARILLDVANLYEPIETEK